MAKSDLHVRPHDSHISKVWTENNALTVHHDCISISDSFYSRLERKISKNNETFLHRGLKLLVFKYDGYRNSVSPFDRTPFFTTYGRCLDHRNRLFWNQHPVPVESLVLRQWGFWNKHWQLARILQWIWCFTGNPSASGTIPVWHDFYT